MFQSHLYHLFLAFASSQHKPCHCPIFLSILHSLTSLYFDTIPISLTFCLPFMHVPQVFIQGGPMVNGETKSDTPRTNILNFWILLSKFVHCFFSSLLFQSLLLFSHLLSIYTTSFDCICLQAKFISFYIFYSLKFPLLPSLLITALPETGICSYTTRSFDCRPLMP
jgi:hypothetical protein